MSTASARRVLVIGATGKTGSRVVDQLHARGHQTRSASRRSPQAPFDWDDPDTYAAAVADVDSVFLTVAGQDPGNGDRVSAFLELAARAGVRRVVLLSARAVEFHPGGALAAVEAAVRASEIPHTILRPSWFAQNFTEAFLAPDQHGVVSAPTGEGREPFIDLEDLAEVAVTALTTDRPEAETVSLSGSQSLSFAAAVDVLGSSTGRSLSFTPADPERYRADLAQHLPPEYVAWRMAMFDAIRDGRDAYLSTGVQELLGRAARSFAEWAASLTPDG